MSRPSMSLSKPSEDEYITNYNITVDENSIELDTDAMKK